MPKSGFHAAPFLIPTHSLGGRMPTRLIPEALARDLTATLARLRTARTVGDEHETYVCENRLNWLIEKIPRPQEVA